VPDEPLCNRARALLKELAGSMSPESPEPFGAFLLDGTPVGSLPHSAISALLRHPGLKGVLRATDTGVEVEPELSWEQAQRRMLCALSLRAQHEKIALPLEGVTIDRALCRICGVPTRVVRLVATRAGQILLARRSQTKRINPGLWDNPVAGMIMNGESLSDGLRREAHEECSICLTGDNPVVLSFETHRPVKEGFINETTYIWHHEGALNAHIGDGEVSAFAEVGFEAFLELAAGGQIVPEAALATLLVLLRAH